MYCVRVHRAFEKAWHVYTGTRYNERLRPRRAVKATVDDPSGAVDTVVAGGVVRAAMKDFRRFDNRARVFALEHKVAKLSIVSAYDL